MLFKLKMPFDKLAILLLKIWGWFLRHAFFVEQECPFHRKSKRLAPMLNEFIQKFGGSKMRINLCRWNSWVNVYHPSQDRQDYAIYSYIYFIFLDCRNLWRLLLLSRCRPVQSPTFICFSAWLLSLHPFWWLSVTKFVAIYS